MKLEKEVKKYIQNRYEKHYNTNSTNKKEFKSILKKYEKLKSFKINENAFEENLISSKDDLKNKLHFVMRMATEYYLTQTFKSMKVNLNDINVQQDLDNGNIGTPGRIAKMWCGSDTNDRNELLSGRWCEPVRLAKFESDCTDVSSLKDIPITKKIDLISVCSHHLAPFSTLLRKDSYALISYIPNGFVLGISKLQKVVENISQRGWLQEDLVKEIYKVLSSIAKTEDVYIKLFNVVHTCESLRGAKTKEGAFTTEAYGGKFKKSKLRKQVLSK